MVYYGSHSEIKFQASVSMSALVIYPCMVHLFTLAPRNFTIIFYDFQHLGKFIICGDFNSRIGDMPDFIEGVDAVT